MPTVQLQLTTKAFGLTATRSQVPCKLHCQLHCQLHESSQVTATESQFPSILAEVTLHSATSSASLWRWQPGMGVPFSRTVLWPQEDKQLGGRTACTPPAGLQVTRQLVKVIGWTLPLEIPTESQRLCGIFP